MPSTRRNFYIPDTLYAALEKKAKEEQRSASDLLRTALVEYLGLPKKAIPPGRFFQQQ